jgi:hypothetical protein
MNVKEATPMNDPAERAAAAVADEVRNGPGRVDRREALAERVAQAVMREWHRPVVLPRRLADDLSLTAEAAIDALLSLEDDEFKLVVTEASSRRLLALELTVFELGQGDEL